MISSDDISHPSLSVILTPKTYSHGIVVGSEKNAYGDRDGLTFDSKILSGLFLS
jgi:hypothetical protein